MIGLEKVEIFEERPARVRAFRVAKDRYIGNSHGVELAKAGDWIVIDSNDKIRHFTPMEFMLRYKAATVQPFLRCPGPRLLCLDCR